MYFFGNTPAGDDLVGITFWIGTMAMMAASAFFPIYGFSRWKMENITPCFWTYYLYSSRTLHVHERCSRRRRQHNGLQVC